MIRIMSVALEAQVPGESPSDPRPFWDWDVIGRELSFPPLGLMSGLRTGNGGAVKHGSAPPVTVPGVLVSLGTV